MKEEIQYVFHYHERTKHHPRRYAASPGFLDWPNEPEPFRRYEGARLLSLPLGNKDPDVEYEDIYKRDNNSFHPFSMEGISKFLELSLGLSAWKSYDGTTWALRMNPSSGNLHPTEAYAILGPVPESNNLGGVYHYSPYLHALELRAEFDDGLWLKIIEHFGTEGFLIGLSSIYWRESWKYGERAFRYCHQDIGHAMAALSFAGNLLGWKITCLNALSDDDIGTLLGFQKTSWIRFEEEHPEVLFFVHRTSESDIPRDIPPKIIEAFQTLSYSGKPNRLSNDHRDWKAIEEVSLATKKPQGTLITHNYKDFPFSDNEMPSKKAAAIIRQRRSALAFDGKASLPKNAFLGTLNKTVARSKAAPFDLDLGEPSVHLFIFVHMVSGMDSGLYFFLRNERDLEKIRRICHHDFLWEKIESPESVSLYLLKKGDFRNEGATAG